jgi:hypothetical protein
MAWLRSDRGFLLVAGLAFVAFLERTILDWRYVYSNVIDRDDAVTTGVALGIYLAFAAAWVWALLAVARGGRSGVTALFIYSIVFLVALGIATPIAFCPAPCDGWVRWPLLEVSNWVGLAIGAVAAAAAWARARAT